MRTFFLNLAGAAALGLSALIAGPVSASPAPTVSLDAVVGKTTDKTFNTVQYRDSRSYRPVRPNYRPGPRPDYRPNYRPGVPGIRPPFVGRPSYRPARECWTERKRVWNGYRFIRRNVRVCR